jgi:Rrf2 family protein
MQFSKAGDYALRAVAYLSQQPSARVYTIREIAHAQQVPQSFLAKLMPLLTRGQVVFSIQGPKGGYRLARPPDQITFLDVIFAVEGPISLMACQEGEGHCDFEDFCNMNKVFAQAQKTLVDYFRNITFADLPVKATQPLSDDKSQKNTTQWMESPVKTNNTR